jgi:hypothetical protein
LGSTIAGGASAVASALGATEVAAAFASEGLMAGLAAMGPVGWAGLAVVGVAAVLGYGGGGGGSSPPPKEPKFHAAIYVTGNNNIDFLVNNNFKRYILIHFMIFLNKLHFPQTNFNSIHHFFIYKIVHFQILFHFIENLN